MVYPVPAVGDKTCPFLSAGYVWKGRKCAKQGALDPLIAKQAKPGFVATLQNTWQLVRGNLWGLLSSAQVEKMPPQQSRHIAYVHTSAAHIAVSTYRPINDQVLALPRYGNGMSGSRGWDNFPVMAGTQNLIMAQGELRRKFLRVFTPLFQTSFIKDHHFQLMKQETIETVRSWSGKKIWIWDSMLQHSARMISATYLGINPDSHKEILNALQTLVRIHFAQAQMRPWAIFCKTFRHYLQRWDLDGYYKAHKTLETSIQASLQAPTRPEFLRIIQANFEPQEVIDNLKMLYFAGTETTASFLSTVVYLLARDKRLQAALRQELNQAKIYSLADIRFDDLSMSTTALVGLKSLVLEALRLVPPLPGQVRTFTEKHTFGEVCFEKGTTIVIDHASHNRDERTFEMPDQFHPERFVDPESGKLEEEAQNEVLKCFGTGVTKCPGQYLALTEVLLLTIELLLTRETTTDDVGLPIDKGASAHINAELSATVTART